MIHRIYQEAFPILPIDKDYILREQSLEDTEAFFNYYSKNSNVYKYVLATVPETLADAASEIEYCRNLFYHKRGIYWSLARQDNNEIIGAVGLYINNHHHRAEICYDLAETYWQQGVMTRAVSRALKFSFTEIDLYRIEALTLKENKGSMRLLEKLGFKREGTLRNYRYFKNQARDVEIFAITADEYAAWQEANP